MLHFYKTIPRLFYGNNDKILDPESLLDIQIKSYKKFIDFKIENSTKIFTSCNGIDKSLKTIFPISSYTGHVVLNYTNCRFKHNNITPEECKIKEINYEAGIFISLNLVFFNKNNKGKQVAGKSYSGEIYIGAIPLMTDNGLFIINGNERVIISQLTRAPGVLFESHYFDNTELCFTAKIIPHKGAWVNIMFGKNGLIYFSINKSKKNLITVLFKAFSFTESQIVSFFFKKIRVKLKKNFINTDMDILYFAGIKIHSDILIKNT